MDPFAAAQMTSEKTRARAKARHDQLVKFRKATIQRLRKTKQEDAVVSLWVPLPRSDVPSPETKPEVEEAAPFEEPLPFDHTFARIPVVADPDAAATARQALIQVLAT